METSLLREFPLLLPQNLQKTVYEGFVSAQGRDFHLKIELPEDLQVKNARLHCSWQLKAILSGYQHILQQRMQHSPDLLSFMLELKMILEVALKNKQELHAPPPPQYYSGLLQELATLGWDKLAYMESSFSTLKLKAQDASGREHLITLRLKAKYPAEPPDCVVDFPVPFSVTWTPQGSIWNVAMTFKSWRTNERTVRRGRTVASCVARHIHALDSVENVKSACQDCRVLPLPFSRIDVHDVLSRDWPLLLTCARDAKTKDDDRRTVQGNRRSRGPHAGSRLAEQLASALAILLWLSLLSFIAHDDFFTPKGSLGSIHSQFVAALDSLKAFWDVMDEIDEKTWVLEPEKPTRSATARRIALGSNTSVYIEVDPRHPTMLPECSFLGADHVVKPLGIKLSKNIHLWDPGNTLLENLKDVLEMDFPARAVLEQSDFTMDCGICYAYQLDGVIPNQVCDNPQCGQPFHQICLYEWLRGLLTSRQSFNTIFGECPYCSKPITLKLPGRKP